MRNILLFILFFSISRTDRLNYRFIKCQIVLFNYIHSFLSLNPNISICVPFITKYFIITNNCFHLQNYLSPEAFIIKCKYHLSIILILQLMIAMFSISLSNHWLNPCLSFELFTAHVTNFLKSMSPSLKIHVLS